MALSHTQRIDHVDESPDGSVMLTVVATDPWDDSGHSAELLTDKLCTYLAYLHSDEYRAAYGPKPATIRLLAAHDPPADVKRLLDRTAQAAGVPIGIDSTTLPRALAAFPGGAAQTGPAPAVVATAPSPAGDRSGWIPAPAPGPSPTTPTLTRNQVVQGVFALVGLLAGVGGAVWAWLQSSSPSLAVYVFLMASYVISRGVADVITDPHKARRVLYFSLLPAISTGILYLAWQRWDRMWLGVVAALVGGMIVHAVVAPLLFPRIHLEEQQDSLERAREMSEKRGKK